VVFALFLQIAKSMDHLATILTKRHEFEKLFRVILAGIKWGVTDQKFEGIAELAPDILQRPWVVSDLKKFPPTNKATKNETADPIRLFTLATLEIWRVEFERAGRQSKPAISLLVGFARYFWPAYLSLNPYRSNEPTRERSDKGAREWLSHRKTLSDALFSLNLKLDPEISDKLKVFLKSDNSTIARARQEGVDMIHAAFCSALGLAIDTPPALTPVMEPPTEHGTHTISTGNLPEDASRISSMFPPIFSPYWQFSENVETAAKLQRISNRLPLLNEISENLLFEKFHGLSLTSDQRVLAEELISYFPYWAVTGQEQPSRSLTRRQLELLWNRFHQENISSIISPLLDAGLLSSAEYSRIIQACRS
jgi:hypothetical protein